VLDSQRYVQTLLWTDDEIILHFGEPGRQLLKNIPSNRPAYLVFNLNSSVFMLKQTGSDFGQAFPGSLEPLEVGIPTIFAAPEVI